MIADTLHAQIIKTGLWSDCVFCHYFSTDKAIVISKSLTHICGRCAEELIVALKEVASKDKRR